MLTAALLLVSLVIHELGHVVAAQQLGDDTATLLGRRTLNPLAHADPVGTLLVPGLLLLAGALPVGWLKPVPVDERRLPPRGMFIVALAGPIANIALGALGVIGYELLDWLWLRELARLNLTLAAFNLLPIKPLDGWRALRSA